MEYKQTMIIIGRYELLEGKIRMEELSLETLNCGENI